MKKWKIRMWTSRAEDAVAELRNVSKCRIPYFTVHENFEDVEVSDRCYQDLIMNINYNVILRIDDKNKIINIE